MALTLQHFVDQLSASGLVAAEEVRALREKNAPADAEQFARLLVKQKVLTAWQAQQVYAGKAKSLVLGNYVCLEKLGQGGMGMVLKAQHRRMKRMVALKVLSPAVAKSPDLIARFHREVEAVAKLSHPNIVTAFDADEAGGTSFLVMEYVDGKDLSSVVKSQGPLSLAQACKCLIQAAKGLEYAHDQRIIHRDIKPANLLIDRQGTVKILDMGLARMDTEAGKTELTSTGAVMGTVDYMAPEQALSSKHADARSDIYSLGITLWYLLIGRPTYEGDSMMARLIGHRESAIPSLAEALAQRPAGAKPVPADKARAIDAVFQKMVAKKPEDRYQTMGQVIRALEAVSTSTESLAGLGAVDPDATYIVPQMSSPNATAARQATMPAAAGTATVKTPQDEDLIPGSPFAATLNTGDQATPTAAGATAASTKKGPPPGVAKASKGGRKQTAKKADRRWLIAVASVSAVLLLAAMFLMFAGKQPHPATKQAPDAPTDPLAALSPSPASSALSNTSATSLTTRKVSCLEFDGIDDYVEVPSLEYDASKPITMELWVESPVPREAEHMPHVMGWTGLFVMTREFNDTQAFRDLIWDQERKIVISQVAPGLANTGHLRHAAAIWDGSRLSVSVDGKMGAIRSGIKADDGAGFSLITKSFTLAGAKQWAAQPGVPLIDFFKGRIAEFRVSRVARYTKDFIPARGWTPDGDTVCLYDFQEGSGSILNDRSANKHDGRIVGATWGSMDLRSDGLVMTSPPAQAPQLQTTATARPAEWTSLISSTADLASHWQAPGPFQLIGGELQADKAGAAVSTESYDDFDLEFEWKVANGANGGLYYRAVPQPEAVNTGSSGMEYQLIDNSGFAGKLTPPTSAGALWGLAAPTQDATRPVGQWNTSRILALGDHIEHWMNGEKVLEVDIGSPAWKEALSKANERIRGNVGRRSGHIALQNQTSTLSFRNMRIRRLSRTPQANAAGWIDLLAAIVPYSENSRGVWTRNSNGYLNSNRTTDSPFPQLNFDPRPYGSYEVEVGVILHEADHAIISLPASSGTATLILGRRAGGAVWQVSGPFDPAAQPNEQKLKFDLKPDVESVVRVRVDVKENGGRVRLSGKVNEDLLPILDRPATELVKVGPPKGMVAQPSKNPARSFQLHIGQGATATLTRFRYRDIRSW
jgi:serine/threonine protein kinase